MNVTCPSCETVYRVDPAKVPAGGVRARCAVCSNVFTVSAVGAVAAAPAAAVPAPAARSGFAPAAAPAAPAAAPRAPAAAPAPLPPPVFTPARPAAPT